MKSDREVMIMKIGNRIGVAIAFFSCCWGIASADSDTAATVLAVPQEFIVAERKDVALEVLELTQVKSRSFEIHEPDASFLKLHFSRFNIPKGITVEVRSPDGRESYRYTRGGGAARTLNRKAGDDGRAGFSAMSISGDTAIVEVLGRLGQVNSLKNRVHIDYYMAGYPEDQLAAAGDGIATTNSKLKASRTVESTSGIRLPAGSRATRRSSIGAGPWPVC